MQLHVGFSGGANAFANAFAFARARHGLAKIAQSSGLGNRVAAADRAAAANYLYERELVTHVYIPVISPIRIDAIGVVAALTFVVDRQHAQYAGKLSPAEAASTIRGAVGRSGANPDYFANTIAHMDELGIHCRRLGDIQRLINQDG